MNNRLAWLLLIVFLAVFIAPLGVRPLMSPDETRYAEIAREMVASGDYTTPHLDGIRYFEKPVFGYWLFAASMNVFGQNAFALRLPVALCAGLAAWSIFLLARRSGGGHWTGFLAATIYLGMPMVFILATVGILDGILSFPLTAGIALFYCATEETESKGKRAMFLAASGAFCGLAFLTKGFLAFAVPALTAAGYLIWERRWKELFTLPWIPAIAALLASLPWAVAIHHAEPEFWNYFVWIEHFQRFFKDSYQHSEPAFFFIPIFLGGAATWVFVSLAIVMGLKETGLKNSLVKYCICWLVLPFIFFSLSKGKLPPYILPCFAPLSILIAIALQKYKAMNWRIEFEIGIWPLVGILSVGTIGLAINQLTGFPQRLFLEGETWKWCVATLAAILWIAALAMLLKTQDFWRRVGLFCIGTLPLMLASHFILPERVEERKAPCAFLETVKAKLPKDVALVSFRNPVQAVCWVFKRDDVYLFMEGGELDDGLKFEDSSHRLLDIDGFQKLLTERGASDTLLVIPNKMHGEIKDKLPEPKWIESKGGRKGYMALCFGTPPKSG